MNMRLEDFYSYTPREFFKMREGFNNVRDADSKQQLLLTRKIMFAALAPHSKNLTEEKIMKFDWEEEAKEKARQMDYEEQKKEIQQCFDYWKDYDKRKGKC